MDYELDVGHFKADESHCGDSIDNDGDGVVDCDDPNCFEREECGRTVLFSELFSTGIPADFQSSGFSEDEWEWCAGVEEGDCTNHWMWGSDLNTFSDSGGGYAPADKPENTVDSPLWARHPSTSVAMATIT